MNQLDLTLTNCPNCGEKIPPDAPGELCSSCLVTAIIGSTPTLDEVADSPPESSGGPSIDGYRVLRKLGEGGFGEVFEAEQLEPIYRIVAVKVLKTNARETASLLRFEAERQALAMLEHQGIARVYGAGETEEGRPFLAMEFVDGEQVADFCEKYQLSLPQRLTLFREICETVAYAHRNGIIHRDLKPSNILVCGDAEGWQSKVIDFGTAKATETFLTNETLITLNNQLLGTPSYMSPEQATFSGEVDTRSEVYSLGILLYEMITGTLPFLDKDLADLPYDEVLRVLRTSQPQRPSLRVRDPGSEKLPKVLDWIVFKAIEKDPALRYQSADSLAADVAAYLTDGLVEAQPPSLWNRCQRVFRKHRLEAVAALSILLAILVGGIVSWNLYLDARASDLEAREQFSRSDLAQAEILADQSPGCAVAHLVRALRVDPDHHLAARRLVHLLAAHDWPTQPFPISSPGNDTGALAFHKPTGQLLVANERGLHFYEEDTGTLLGHLPLPGRSWEIAQSPDDTHAAVFASGGGLAIVDLRDRKQVAFIGMKNSRGGNASFSADGKWLACASDQGRVSLWNVEDQTQIEIPDSAIRTCFSRHGNQLALFRSGGFRLTDPAKAQLNDSHVWHPLPGGFIEGEFTPDGTHLVIRTRDDTVRLYDADDGSMEAEFSHHRPLESYCVGPYGRLLATGTKDGTVRLWNLKTHTPLGRSLAFRGEFARVFFDPSGEILACGMVTDHPRDPNLHLISVRSGRPICPPLFHPRGARVVAFEQSGMRLAVGSRSRTVAVWDLNQSSMQALMLKHDKPVWRMSFSEDSSELRTVAKDGEVSAWEIPAGKRMTASGLDFGKTAMAAFRGVDGAKLRLKHLPRLGLDTASSLIASRFRDGNPKSWAICQEGEILITLCEDGFMRKWSLLDGELLRAVEGRGEIFAGSANGRLAACGFSDGTIQVWNFEKGMLQGSFQAHGEKVTSLEFSNDDKFLASGSIDGTTRLIDLVKMTMGRSHKRRGAVTNLEFQKSGKIFAASGPDSTASIWSGREAIQLVHDDKSPPTGLMMYWNQAGDRLITTGGFDSTSRVWDSTSGNPLTRSMRQPAGAYCAALSPDENSFLVGTDGVRNARVWDTRTGNPVTPLLEHDGAAISCAISDRYYAVATTSGKVFVYPLTAEQFRVDDSFLNLAESLGGFVFDRNGDFSQNPRRASGKDSHGFDWPALIHSGME